MVMNSIIEHIVTKFQNTKIFKDVVCKNVFESHIGLNYINFVGDWCLIRYYNTSNDCQYDVSNIKRRLNNVISISITHEFPERYDKFKSITNTLIKAAEIDDIDRILEFIDITLDFWFYDWNTKNDTAVIIPNIDKVKIAYEFKSKIIEYCKFLSEYHTYEEINNYIDSI